MNGFIFPEGLINISIGKNGKLVILGNITLRKGSQIIIREGAICDIGKNVFINRNCSLVCRKSITIKCNVLIGEAVKIYDNDHYFDNNLIYKDKYITQDICIGENVWVGNDVNILKGSLIPDNSVIGSMSLVRSELTESGIYVGIPAKLIKKRYAKNTNC